MKARGWISEKYVTGTNNEMDRPRRDSTDANQHFDSYSSHLTP